jgi:tRNA pseudouridine55 synthase
MKNRSRNRQDAVDGLLLLNKPAGITSNQALQKVRRLLNARKAGHTGSLDPGATGMLPLCFGEATKVCAYLLDADKTYRVTVKLGVATDTGDADGTETGRAAVPALDGQQWSRVLDAFKGESMQVPPMYSALKKDGRRLYELARKGEIVERKPRPIRIDSIELLESHGTRLVFRVTCSKGTYIRTLVEDIAARVGTVAHTARLHREAVAGFRPEYMLDLPQLEAEAQIGVEALRSHLLEADVALEGMLSISLNAAESVRFGNGQAVAPSEGSAETGLVRVYGVDREFLGVGERIEDGRILPRRIFNPRKKNT